MELKRCVGRTHVLEVDDMECFTVSRIFEEYISCCGRLSFEFFFLKRTGCGGSVLSEHVWYFVRAWSCLDIQYIHNRLVLFDMAFWKRVVRTVAAFAPFTDRYKCREIMRCKVMLYRSLPNAEFCEETSVHSKWNQEKSTELRQFRRFPAEIPEIKKNHSNRSLLTKIYRSSFNSAKDKDENKNWIRYISNLFMKWVIKWYL